MIFYDGNSRHQVSDTEKGFEVDWPALYICIHTHNLLCHNGVMLESEKNAVWWFSLSLIQLKAPPDGQMDSLGFHLRLHRHISIRAPWYRNTPVTLSVESCLSVCLSAG